MLSTDRVPHFSAARDGETGFPWPHRTEMWGFDPVVSGEGMQPLHVVHDCLPSQLLFQSQITPSSSGEKPVLQ